MRKGERYRKSVRGCIISRHISVLHLVIVKKGAAEIPGLTDESVPCARPVQKTGRPVVSPWHVPRAWLASAHPGVFCSFRWLRCPPYMWAALEVVSPLLAGA